MEKGLCYHDCLLILLTEHPDWTLVHGYPTLTGGPKAGCRFGHAWLEYTCEHGIPWCFDHATRNAIPAALYYGVGRIDPSECRRYTAEEAEAAAHADPRSNGELFCGPWGEVPEDVLFAD